MPGRPLEGGEDDAAVSVVLSVGFVLAHNGELGAVDGQELSSRVRPEATAARTPRTNSQIPDNASPESQPAQRQMLFIIEKTGLQDVLRITKQRLDIAR